VALKVWESDYGYGLSVNEYDKCVYFKVMKCRYVILCLYVDDILIFGTKLEDILIVKNYLSKSLIWKT